MAIIEEDSDELYEHAPCGYFSMLPDGTVVKINDTLLGWLGTARDEVLGKRFQDLLTGPGKIYHDTHYMPLLAMQGFAREIAFDLRRSAAAPLPVMVTTVARRDDAGRVVSYRTAVFESSSRRAYERELLQQRRAAEQEATARSAMLAMISHDIRSPLSSILMAAELLRARDPAQERYVRIVKHAASNVLELVDALLAHSKLQAGAAHWQAEPADLRALLTEIVSIHSLKAETKGIELRVHVDPSVPPVVSVDRFKLGQVITNLVSNALKFTERGHVAVELRALSIQADVSTIELRVEDTGIGIPAEKLTAIFTPFQQASESTSRRYGGTGLGLAISRQLLALAGGSLEVVSQLGQGSSFRCVLAVPIPPAPEPLPV